MIRLVGILLLAQLSIHLSAAEKSAKLDTSVSEAQLKKITPSLLEFSKFSLVKPKPISITEPEYPYEFSDKGVEGSVLVWFDIDIKGVPRNLSVVETESNKEFIKYALDAVKNWRFQPVTEPTGNLRLRQSYSVEFKESSNVSLKEARHFLNLRKQARTGDAKAQYEVGKMQIFKPKLMKKQTPTQWFLKAAIQGHSEAQYMLARALLLGQGCEKDSSKAKEWLELAIKGGNESAKNLLAVELANSSSKADKQKAFDFLSGTNQLNSYEKILLAQMFTDKTNAFINPERAIEIVDGLDSELFFDPITPYQIKGDAYFALEKFEEALDAYEDALDEAEDLEADLTYIQDRIAKVKEKLPEDEGFFF